MEPQRFTWKRLDHLDAALVEQHVANVQGIGGQYDVYCEVDLDVAGEPCSRFVVILQGHGPASVPHYASQDFDSNLAALAAIGHDIDVDLILEHGDHLCCHQDLVIPPAGPLVSPAGLDDPCFARATRLYADGDNGVFLCEQHARTVHPQPWAPIFALVNSSDESASWSSAVSLEYELHRATWPTSVPA